MAEIIFPAVLYSILPRVKNTFPPDTAAVASRVATKNFSISTYRSTKESQGTSPIN